MQSRAYRHARIATRTRTDRQPDQEYLLRGRKEAKQKKPREERARTREGGKMFVFLTSGVGSSENRD